MLINTDTQIEAFLEQESKATKGQSHLYAS